MNSLFELAKNVWQLAQKIVNNPLTESVTQLIGNGVVWFIKFVTSIVKFILSIF